MENNILIFLHLMAAGVGVGSLSFALFLFLPAWKKKDTSLEEGSVAFTLLNLLPTTVFVCVLVLVGTGIIYLMENYTLQVNFETDYYNLFGAKMAVVIVVFFLTAYQSFGLRSRITHLDLRPENKTGVPDVLRKLEVFGKVSLGLIVLAVFLGVWLARF